MSPYRLLGAVENAVTARKANATAQKAAPRGKSGIA
jgi:hypothetical protein